MFMYKLFFACPKKSYKRKGTSQGRKGRYLQRVKNSSLVCAAVLHHVKARREPSSMTAPFVHLFTEVIL